ncbi:hypothetical protein [Gorillibacterium massiliense]|uniref:hypothetical protein n=1 Tax=Gorillibacterium massiliense TaxID=1280390 RepID=UPI000594E0E3|nr:hypothetical protein [Gorillibacterium massiliense]
MPKFVGIKKKRLVVIDGMPGSGKTTCATMIANKLTSWNIINRCILELEENHPLFIHDHRFSSFEDDEQADLYIRLLQSKFKDFVNKCTNDIHDVTIIESVLFQDAINCAHHMGMNHDKLLHLSSSLMGILEPLEPLLIYFYQVDVEGQWRFICGVRGNEWGPVSLHTDDDFREAGILWGGSQSFVRSIIDSWEVPKIIIENKDYHWDEYSNRIIQFVRNSIR